MCKDCKLTIKDKNKKKEQLNTMLHDINHAMSMSMRSYDNFLTEEERQTSYGYLLQAENYLIRILSEVN